MIDLVKNYTVGVNLIPVEHHFVISESALDDVAIGSYRSGFAACKKELIKDLQNIIKDETLKGLLIDRIFEYDDGYGYLDQ